MDIGQHPHQEILAQARPDDGRRAQDGYFQVAFYCLAAKRLGGDLVVPIFAQWRPWPILGAGYDCGYAIDLDAGEIDHPPDTGSLRTFEQVPGPAHVHCAHCFAVCLALGDQARQVMRHLHALAGALHCIPVAHVSRDPFGLGFRVSGDAQVKGPHRVAPGQQPPHQVAPQEARRAGHQMCAHVMTSS